MPVIRGGASNAFDEDGALGGAGGGLPPAGRGRPCRVSTAAALASFDWTDDAIIEVSQSEDWEWAKAPAGRLHWEPFLFSGSC